jgi:hypothetical protein
VHAWLDRSDRQIADERFSVSGARCVVTLKAIFERAKRPRHLVELLLRVLDKLADLAHLVGRSLGVVRHVATVKPPKQPTAD